MSATEYEFAAAERSARDWFDSVEMLLGPMAREEIRTDQSVGEYLHTLIGKQFYLDALRVMAYTLPIRHAVWWGCMGVAEAQPPATLSTLELEALQATTRWVVLPTDEHLQEVEDYSMQLDLELPIAFLTRAVCHEDLPMPRPKYSKPQDFRARAVHSSLWVSAAMTPDPQQMHCRFLELGLDVSRGERLWPEPPKSES